MPPNNDFFKGKEESIYQDVCGKTGSDIDYATRSPEYELYTPPHDSQLDQDEETDEVHVHHIPAEEMKKPPTYLNKDNVEKGTSEKTEKKETYDKQLPEINLFSDARSGIDKDNLLISEEEFAHGIFSDSESLLNDDANGNNVQQGSQRLPVSEETLKTSMDCPKLTTNTFFMEEIPNKATFRLTDDEWKRIKPTYDKPDKLQPCWTYVMAPHLSDSNDYCTFRFKRHFIQRQSSRKRNCDIFNASGNCVFLDCTCTFKLTMQRTQFHIKEISVQYEGNVKTRNGREAVSIYSK
jgi:hypothetical protein